MWQNIKEDIQVISQRDPALRSVWEIALAYPGFHAILLHRLAHWLMAAPSHYAGAFREPYRPIPYRHRDPSRREDRPALFYRPRHGCR